MIKYNQKIAPKRRKNVCLQTSENQNNAADKMLREKAHYNFSQHPLSICFGLWIKIFIPL